MRAWFRPCICAAAKFPRGLSPQARRKRCPGCPTNGERTGTDGQGRRLHPGIAECRRVFDRACAGGDRRLVIGTVGFTESQTSKEHRL